MEGRRASAVPRASLLPRQENKLPEWVVFFLTASIDIVCSKGVGVVPSSGVDLIRAAVMFTLYREWVLAIACGFFLPAMVPLTAVCLLKNTWVAFRTKALAALEKERVRMAAASGPPTQAGVPRHNTAHSGRATQRGGGRSRPPGEMSGYDVSTVTGEEVVELTSWAASTTSAEPGPRIRR